MFVLRAKARLSDASADISVLGLAGDAAFTWLAGQGITLDDDWAATDCAGGRVLRLPPAPGTARWMWLGAPAQAEAVLAALPTLDGAAWDGLEIAAGVVPVQAATSGLFVPQMLNYELVGGVDFKKGCYPGQEIVARSHYLGKLKRRGVVLRAAVLTEPARAGQEIWWSGDTSQPAGQVAQAAGVADGGWLLLAELKLLALGDAPEGGDSRLHLGAIDGPVLTRMDLPYVLPQEENRAA
jgi:folate-binding protein YgfZ